MIKVYFDGACEPVNPGGIAAYGLVILNNDKELVRVSKVFKPQKGKEKETSNNVAEYSGFLDALNWLLLGGYQNEKIRVFGDSKLVICQMFGDPELGGRKWKMRGGFYKPVALKAQKVLEKFKDIKGQWLPREENNLADELSKAELIKNGVEFKIQPQIAC